MILSKKPSTGFEYQSILNKDILILLIEFFVLLLEC